MPYDETTGRSIPAGATRVRDRKSDAVAYVYDLERTGRVAAMMFYGKARKPVWHYTFRDAAQRERRVVEGFANRQARLAADAERRAERKAKLAKPSRLEVGHVLVATWGYDQTNVDFFQVVRVVSGRMVEIRPIASRTVQETGWAQGRAIPEIDAFTGDALRKRVGEGDTIKLESFMWARIWDGRPVAWTAYA